MIYLAALEQAPDAGKLDSRESSDSAFVHRAVFPVCQRKAEDGGGI